MSEKTSYTETFCFFPCQGREGLRGKPGPDGPAVSSKTPSYGFNYLTWPVRLHNIKRRVMQATPDELVNKFECKLEAQAESRED